MRDLNTVKKIVGICSILVILLCGIACAIRMASFPPTYDGKGTDLVALYEDPSAYDNEGADGVAAVIVNTDREKTVANNVVFSVVFNYRGYDTLGESFILIGAIAGCIVVLRRTASDTEGKGVKTFNETGTYRIRGIINRSASNIFLPLALVFGGYVILHGSSSAGGGFQGGVLASAAILLIFLGHGSKGLKKTFNVHRIHSTETIAEIIYVVIGLLGIFSGMTFATNFILAHDRLETTMLMNDAVGYHVMAGITCLMILMLGQVGEALDHRVEEDL